MKRSDLVDPELKALADSLVRAREEYEADMNIPVDDFQITLGLEVRATWQRGFVQTQTDPEEPAGYEIHKVVCNGLDITALFSEDDMERLLEVMRT